MKGLLTGDVARLACPACGGALTYAGTERSGWLWDGGLGCGCGLEFRVEDGRPWLYSDDDVHGIDRFMRKLYDLGGWSHDFGVTMMFPLWEKGGSEHRFRTEVMSWMDLESLTARPDGEPLRILETSSGAGGNLPYILERIPEELEVEIWALDFSETMMDLCRGMLKRRQLRAPGGGYIKLLMGDAHTLPFPDDTFDRILHLGAITAFADPPKALREMIRVTRPDVPIVVVDEALDHTRKHPFETRLAFMQIVPHIRNPQPPREALPAHAELLADDPIGRMYYLWAFKVPTLPPPPSS